MLILTPYDAHCCTAVNKDEIPHEDLAFEREGNGEPALRCMEAQMPRLTVLALTVSHSQHEQ